MEDPIRKTYFNKDGIKKITFVQKIGGDNDSYSVVYKANYENSQVAIKLIKNTQDNLQTFHNEYNALTMFGKCDYIIDFIDIIQSTDATYLGIITDLQGGNLLENVGINQHFDEKTAAIIMYQLLQAIDTLHQKGVVHRNINLNNVLISNYGNYPFIRLTGFSIAADATQSNSIRQQLGVPLYWAPEIVRNETYSYSVDIWAAGVIMYYILTGFVPFNPFDQSVMFQQIVNGIKIDSFPSNPPISNEAKDLILKMLDINPFNRVTAREALNHPWFDNYVPYIASQLKNKISNSYEDTGFDDDGYFLYDF